MTKWRRVAGICLGAWLVVAAVSAFGKEQTFKEKGVLADMQSVSCGYTEKSGHTVAGAIITGAEHKKSQELLCQEYTVKTDRVTYRIRPVDEKHPVLLPVGELAEFRLKKDKMLLKIPEAGTKEREYVVVSMTATQELATEIEKTRRPPKPHTGKPLTIEPAEVTQSAPQSAAASARTAPPAAPAPAATTGAVRVDSMPSGAEVFIDSALAGRTPAAITVSPGAHSVQVVMPGYQDFVTRIEVPAGAQRQVTATLAR